MFLRASRLLLLLIAFARSAAAAPLPANQLVVAGNACGPTALLNAFRFGNPAWQRALTNIPGATDKLQIVSIIRESGMRPSKHIIGRPRWSKKGINIADLCDVANETTHGQMLPQVSQEVLFLRKGESQEKLLQRVHQRLDLSLSKGLPPVVSVRRYVFRRPQGKPGEWTVLDAHFVTLITMPRKLEKNARSFPVTYIDPWGGKISTGQISIANRPVMSDSPATSPCLEAIFPQASVGKKLVRSGEQSVLTVSAALGRW